MVKIFLLAALLIGAALPPQVSTGEVSEAVKFIRQRRYDEAFNRLEQALEARPGDPEAQTFLAVAHMYTDLDFLAAQRRFEAAFSAGGGASFYVNHSHESLSEEDFTDYCRGWIHLRKGGLEFAPDDSEHGFQMRYADVIEFKQNRRKKLFHIKKGDKNQNFRPRSSDERETLLILVLYKKFARS